MMRVKMVYKGRKVTFGALGIRPQQMHAIGAVAEQSIRQRVAKAIGSDDSPMPPLKQKRRVRFSKSQGKFVEYGAAEYGWPRIKRKMGLNPIRDLMGTGTYYQKGVGFKSTGHMLDAFRITYVDNNLVRLDITTQGGREKARGNERRAPWFGLSPKDAVTTLKAVEKVFKGMADSVATAIGGGGRAGGATPVPIWMDPMGFGANRGFVPVVPSARAQVRAGRLKGI